MAEPDYEVLDRTVAFQGHFRVDRYRFRCRLYQGGMSRTLTREVFERGNAAAVLPYDPARDVVVLIEQFRIGALSSLGQPWCLEPVAGVIDEGEAPDAVARREALEEAGLEIGALMPICDYLVSPGGSSERISLFLGRVDSPIAGGIHGLAHEGEDIRSIVLPFNEAWREMMGRQVAVAHLLIAMQWLALNRDMVRREWGVS